MTPTTPSRRALARTLGLLLPLAGCGAHTDSHEAHEAAEAHEGGHGHGPAGTYAVTRPVRRPTEITRPYVAQIRAHQHIEVRALERGYLTDLFVDEGQAIREGERMFQIMPRIYEAEAQRAEAEAAFAQIELDNTRILADREVVSPNELALARARMAKADAEVALARAHLDLTRLRAPFDGIVGRLEVRKGSLLEEGELLTTLSDNRTMWVYFNVTEAEYLDTIQRMSRHEPFAVTLQLANGTTFAEQGIVQTIESDFNPETGNIAFRATFPNPTGLLRHGETGNVIVTTTLPDALVIPQKATFGILDKTYVYVVDANGVAHQREITVGAEVPHLYVVREGLTEDDRVLIDGLRKVRDGQAVKTAFQEPDAVIASLAVHAE